MPIIWSVIHKANHLTTVKSPLSKPSGLDCQSCVVVPNQNDTSSFGLLWSSSLYGGGSLFASKCVNVSVALPRVPDAATSRFGHISVHVPQREIVRVQPTIPLNGKHINRTPRTPVSSIAMRFHRAERLTPKSCALLPSTRCACALFNSLAYARDILLFVYFVYMFSTRIRNLRSNNKCSHAFKYAVDIFWLRSAAFLGSIVLFDRWLFSWVHQDHVWFDEHVFD